MSEHIFGDLAGDMLRTFILIYVATFAVATLQDIFSAEKIKDFVSGKNRFIGYFVAVGMGIFTPFCSCSSIPVFIGFLAAKIPLGIAMAFLVSSPLLSEIAMIILPTAYNGVELMVLYIVSGSIISVAAGWLTDYYNPEKYIIFRFPQRRKLKRKLLKGKNGVKDFIISAHNFAYGTLKGIALFVL